jgi:class 3 adenylate cyclase
MRAAIALDNARRRAAGRAPVRVRIGIHRGPLVVGNIGAPGRINYTVVGDTVNVAQRLQELGRQVPDPGEVAIVVSEALVEEAGPGFAFQKVAELPIRGRHEPVSAYALRGMAAPVAA